MIDLEELKKLAKAATPGPWTSDEHYGCVETAETPDCCDDSDECRVIAKLNYTGRCCAPVKEEFNAAFIAAANPQTVLALLQALEAAMDGLRHVKGGSRELSIRQHASDTLDSVQIK